MEGSSKKVMGAILVFTVAALCTRVAAQSGCTNVLLGLMPCLSFVTGGSSTPSTSCCSQLANVVQSQPRCLCVIVNSGNGASLGVTINQTLALSLPAACQVKTPPVSNCNAGSPKGSPGSTPLGPAVSGGSKVTPLNGPTTSSVLPAAMPALQLMFLPLSLISSTIAFGNI
ncbi:hypothetical protein MLD38_016925 [Melastoma candidum]|uniref:Uncharacterized protein n=1 Tax=Melastoma candidum TaxID=119954 RepID=A0ACB9QSG7_9MYRT|nr:hypothetical protein MLD38_016925 [Melastoma candidum]